jgi:hypothetical protein
MHHPLRAESYLPCYAPFQGERPRRPRLSEAGELAGRLSDPADAWERLAAGGLIPADWVGSPARVFRRIGPRPMDSSSREAVHFAQNMDGGPPGRCVYYITDRPYPFSVEDAILFAAGAEGVQCAESAARRFCERARPWGGRSPARAAWLTLSATEPTWCGFHNRCLDLIGDVLDVILEERGALPPADASVPYEQRLGSLWRVAADLDAVVPAALSDPYFLHGALGPPFVPEALRGARLRDLPDPFEPLAELWATRYRLDGVTDEAIVLAMPPR